MTTNSLNNQCLNDFSVTSATSGDTATLTVSNSSDTASSISRSVVSVSSSSTSDLFTRYAVSTTNQYAIGIDNSDSDKLKIAYAASDATPSSSDLFSLDSVGRLLKSSSPMFKAYLSSTVTNVTGDGTSYQIILNAESFDTGSNFNTTTGLFTAPVAGKYLFVGFVRCSDMRDTTHDTGAARISVNGGTPGSTIVQLGCDVPPTAGDVLTFYAHAYLMLAANDTVGLLIKIDDASKDVDVSGGLSLTYLCGMLIG